MVHEIENFYGVYLLYCLNERYKGRTYIGFTVDPNRRIKQHNTGAHAGGAYKTSGKGPWEMVLIVHGFPNEISALRFEWAWQHPEKSRRLKHLTKKRKSEKQFDYRFRIVSEMLRTAPWKRLALTIRWLKQEFSRDFDPSLTPPLHMALAYGPVRSTKVKPGSTKGGKSPSKSDKGNSDEIAVPLRRHSRCAVCKDILQDPDEVTVSCYHPRCMMVSHIVCLANRFLSRERRVVTQGEPEEVTHMVPVEGACPRCSQPLLWGDVIRHKHGCYQNLTQKADEVDGEEIDHWSNDLLSQKPP
ncbi:structure-specific endonuclease subunit slx1-like isoform X2 [Mya arenaria]|uniref:structure-specific endonuclease subunit slx1-like isoform X2 n=1 Tax=Mya arenaria TaxID=6604 RepID=UPI0022E5C9BD|nr:structure-specific endonuclease subunit slx1-like isoform X2 [Mya arenaria]